MSGPLRWKLLFGFVLVFLAGLAAGVYLGTLQSHKQQAEVAPRRPLAERVRARMEAQLGLTPEQVSKTSPIFEKTALSLDGIRTETANRVRQTLATADQELFPLLTPEQREKLKSIQAERAEARGDRSPAGQ